MQTPSDYTGSNTFSHILPDGRGICETCGKVLSDKYLLKRHYETHEPGKLRCRWPTCGKLFRQKTNFEDHLNIHTGTKPYSCTQCGRRFTARCTLSRHKRIHQRPVKTRRTDAPRMPSCSPCPTDVSYSSDNSLYTATSTESNLWFPADPNPPSVISNDNAQAPWFMHSGSDSSGGDYPGIPTPDMYSGYIYFGTDYAFPLEPKQSSSQAITNDGWPSPSPNTSFPRMTSESFGQLDGYSYSTETMHSSFYTDPHFYSQGALWATIPSLYETPSSRRFDYRATTPATPSNLPLYDPMDEDIYPTQTLPSNGTLDLNY